MKQPLPLKHCNLIDSYIPGALQAQLLTFERYQ